MNNKQNFKDELDQIKLKVTKFIYNLFLSLATIASVISLFYIFALKRDYSRVDIIALLLITITTTIILFLIRIRLNTSNYKSAIILIALVLLIISLVYSLLRGTLNSFQFPLMITGILGTSIVINTRLTTKITYLTLFLYLGIAVLHNLSTIKYTPLTTNSDILDTLVIIIFILVILNISRIGYSQIEKSYEKALKYSNQLEVLNKELDIKVKDRTKILKKNFDKQIESMYNTAIIGNIAKPLLHDIATPVSSLGGVIDLIQRNSRYDGELIAVAKESVQQISDLVLEGRELIRGRDIIQIFEIRETIQKVIKILKSEIAKDDINITLLASSSYRVKGVIGLFERIMINLIVNSIEELKNKENNRIINIELHSNDINYLKIVIQDNGRGIDENSQKYIFDENFTLKNNYYNLGLGLPFVKKTIEEKFKGKISIESKVNLFCKFILTFNIYNEKKEYIN